MAGEAQVEHDRVDRLGRHYRHRRLARIDRRDDIIAAMLQRMLVIERDQRIILDDQQPLDARRARRKEHRNSVPPRHDALPPVVQYRFDLPSPTRCFSGYARDLKIGSAAWRKRGWKSG